MPYVVKSPLVLVTDEQGSVQYLYAGAAVPAYVSDDRIKELRKEGHIEKAGVTEPPVDEQPPAKNASLEKWQEFARSKGATDADLDGVSRDDLVAAYGS
jgi:hypothetical protein